jgi:predicted Zn-dependent protease
MPESTNTPPPAPSPRAHRARALKKGALGGALSIFVAAWAVVATTHGGATSADARGSADTTANDDSNSASDHRGGDSDSYDGGSQDSDWSDPWSIAKQAARSALDNATNYSAPAAPGPVPTGQS